MRHSDGIQETPQPSFSVKMPPRKPTNASRRTREYLTPQEVDRVIAAARKMGRHGGRNTALMLLMYRHGLRVAEAVALRWEVIDMQAGTIHVCRVKQGNPAVHPLRGPELRALRQLRRLYPDTAYLFVSERGGPLTARAVHHIVLRAGKLAGLSFPIHPHMLRHACGFYLANRGFDTRAIQQYLGHSNIQHTVRYTALTPHRFAQFWDD
jgi:type 1 fimbriae regulatory protein FimB/type 1 fimbriae regulatory protein FimE